MENINQLTSAYDVIKIDKNFNLDDIIDDIKSDIPIISISRIIKNNNSDKTYKPSVWT